MKINKDKRTCFRLESNDYSLLCKLAKNKNTTVSNLIRQQIKQIIENVEV